MVEFTAGTDPRALAEAGENYVLARPPDGGKKGTVVARGPDFSQLMVQAGQSAATARTMFDHSVVAVFIGAAIIAAVVSVVLASLLAVRLARPLDAIAAGARRVARGEYQVRV